MTPPLLDKQFFKPPTTLKKAPALFHAILKFLLDTKSCNRVIAITHAFIQRQTIAYLRQVNYFLVCTRTELPTPSSSDLAFLFYFAFILKLGVMYVWHAGDDENGKPIEIRCEWLASKLKDHCFPTEIQTALLKRPQNSM